MLTYFASPDGGGDGLSVGSPTSLTGAQALVQAAAGTDDITVYLRGGTYELAAPLAFGAADSGSGGYRNTWAAYQAEVPVVSGAIQVTGWTLVDEIRNLYSASVPTGTKTRQLYVEGQRATRARRDTSMQLCTVAGSGATYVSTDAAMPTFARPGDLEFAFDRSPWQPWAHHRLGVTSVSRVGDNTTFTMDGEYQTYLDWMAWKFPGNPTFGTWPTTPTWIENALEFLDSTTKGCWYLDEGTDTLYYVPRDGENMATADVRLPVLEALLVADGMADVTFSGITFAHQTWLRPSTDKSFIDIQANVYLKKGVPYLSDADALNDHHPDAAVQATGASGVAFSGCTFTATGGVGLYLGKGSADCAVSYCSFTDTSSHGMRLGDTTAFAVAPADEVVRNEVSDCLFEYNAQEYRDAVALFAGFTEECVVTHNEIRHLPYSGIHYGWGWVIAGYDTCTARANEISYNLIYDCLRELDDGGAIYVNSWQGSTATGKTIVHHNYAHSMGEFFPLANCVFYTDAGFGVTWHHNVGVQVGGKPGRSLITVVGPTWDVEFTDYTNYASSGFQIYTNPAEYPVILNTLYGTDPSGWAQEAQDIAAGAGIREATTTTSTSTSTTTSTTTTTEAPVPNAVLLIRRVQMDGSNNGALRVLTSDGRLACADVGVLSGDVVRLLTTLGLRGVR